MYEIIHEYHHNNNIHPVITMLSLNVDGSIRSKCIRIR